MKDDFEGSMEEFARSLQYNPGQALYEANVAILKAKNFPGPFSEWQDLSDRERGFWEGTAEHMNTLENPND